MTEDVVEILPIKAPRKKPVTAIDRVPPPHEVSIYPQPPDTDVWWCAECGARYCYRRVVPGLRGGPQQRMIDRRYGKGTCWRALRKPDGKKYHVAGKVVVLVADQAPNPIQPEQGAVKWEPIESRSEV